MQAHQKFETQMFQFKISFLIEIVFILTQVTDLLEVFFSTMRHTRRVVARSIQIYRHVCARLVLHFVQTDLELIIILILKDLSTWNY